MILIVISAYSLTTGIIPIATSEVLVIIKQGLWKGIENDRNTLVVFNIRLPRLVLGILVGGGLAICGTVMQALFRNPMADPSLLGVSAGAALGAVTSIVLGVHFLPLLPPETYIYLLPISAFLGGFISFLIVFKLAKVHNNVDIPTMLLAGVAMNAIIGALIGLLSYYADNEQLREWIFWSLGSLEITDWKKLFVAMIIILPCSVLCLFYANALNANLLGENEARHLGFDVEKNKFILISIVSIIVGVCVSLSGIIGFVGLLVPHLLRLVIGSDHRVLLPASGLFGAILLVSADIVGRTIAMPASIPIGIITALLGGPFFIFLLIRYRAYHLGHV